MNKKLQFTENLSKIFLFFLVLGFYSQTYASAAIINPLTLEQLNESKVTLKLDNASIKSILYEIQKQTKINFIYTDSELSTISARSVNVKNKSVAEVLNTIFAQTDFTYQGNGNSIAIMKKVPANKNSDTKILLKGKVVDSSKKPISGATILVLGTTQGFITNEIGEFLLSMKEGQEIEISYVGMVTEKRKITNSEDNYTITLREDILSVEDVVVTGIVDRRAGSFTGSATTIKGDELKRVGSQNVFQALRNIDPSLMIFDNMEFGSDPNKNPKMSLRGTSAFDISGGDSFDIKGTYGNDPNAPLFILDGFEASIQKVSDLDMNRVASVTILKDASAKAIYGSKAANGVIVIETQRSKSAELRISYRGSLDIQAPDLTSYNLANAKEKLELEVAAGKYYEENLSNLYNKQRDYNQILTAVVSGIDTDWMAKPLRNGVGTKHGITFDVGTDKLSLLASFSYNNVQGTMKGSNRTNYEGSISISYRYKTLNIRNNLSVNSNIANDSPYGNFAEYAQMNPYYSPIDAAGNIVQNVNIISAVDNFIANPLYNATLNTKLSNEYVDITNNVNIDWTIVPGLKATGRFGITEKRIRADEFYPANHLKFRGFSGDEMFRKGSYKINEGDDKKLSGDFNTQFSKVLANKHYLFANAGFNLTENSYEEIAFNAEGFPNDKMNDIIFAKQYVKDGKPSGRESTIRDIGFLVMANYAYDDRYLFDGSYRTNASSQFGKSSRWGEFWSVGIGWNIHNEKWLRDSKVTLLKLRASTGYTGAQSSSAYDALATYQYILDQTYQGFLGSTLKGMRNNDLKWQDKQDYNVGLDFNLGRLLTFKFDYYIGKTKNNLLSIDLPFYTGFGTIMENVGNVENKGFDLRVGVTPWNIAKDRAYLTISANISSNKNKVTDVSKAIKSYNDKQNALAGDKFNNRPVQKYQDDVSIDAIWAVKSLGIDPTDGKEIYLDKDGKVTKQYYTSNLVVCGNSLPKLQGNVGLSFGYKGFDLNAVFRFQYGGQMYNQTLADKVENADVKEGTTNVDKRVYDGRWRKAGDIKPYKALSRPWVQEPGEKGAYIEEKTQATSRFVMDRNEFGLGALSAGYDFYSHKFLKKVGMQRLRVSFNMNDVFLLSSIKIERGTSYPFARSFNFALEATF